MAWHTDDMHELIDSHSHLDVSEFDADRDAVVDRARAAGVSRQIIPAISRAGFENLKSLCCEVDGLFPAYGMHPIYLDDHRSGDIEHLAEWLQRERAVAVGECGLDFYVEGLDLVRQREIFDAQLELAKDLDLPVIVHALRAVEDVIMALRRVGGLRGVVHSYGGSAEQAQRLWEMGFHIGVGGPVTYERARRLREIVASMPIEFLLLESDAPDQPLSTHRGARNEPAYLVEVLDVVASLRNADPAEVAAATSRNAVELFRLPATPQACVGGPRT
ncbi:MAG: TatD family hydrolase [Dokdonella sp.]